jgi:adenosylcobinamide-phosphate synthase
MIFFTVEEIVVMIIIAIVIDWWIGDPRWLTHPVIVIGRCVRVAESFLRQRGLAGKSGELVAGTVLLLFICVLCLTIMLGILYVASLIHPWLCYIFNTWFISTTIACKGLKQAALEVLEPLQQEDLDRAKTAVSYIVGRDTDRMNQEEVVRATVETVSENTVDAFLSPLFYAVIGAAPLAIMYRAVNTLDSMVGYKNDKYRYFGRASARFDDVLNFIPARITGLLLAIAAWILFGFAAFVRAIRAIIQFAHLHPSPNSGIPESAVAGALHIQLGGINYYGKVTSNRARLGWPFFSLSPSHIEQAVQLLYMLSYLVFGGFVCLLCLLLFSF